jgi:hypothetical protein
MFSSDVVFPSEATTELEHLCAVVDTFLNFLGVALCAREERLWNMRRHILDAIESGIRHGAGVALAMAEVSVEADLTGVSGFPTGEELRHHEDLVARYGPAREAVAAYVPTTEGWRGSPSLGFFLCFALLMAHRRLFFYLVMDLL